MEENMQKIIQYNNVKTIRLPLPQIKGNSLIPNFINYEW